MQVHGAISPQAPSMLRIAQGDPKLTRLFHFPDVEVEQDETSVRTRYGQGDNLWVGGAGDARPDVREGRLVTPESARRAEAVRAPVAAFVTRRPLPVSPCTALAQKQEDGSCAERRSC
jgi:hypothetical protein